MRKGAWNFELLLKHTKMIDTYEYQGKRYALYLDYSNILILVCVTDMWYIYVDDYMPEHTEIVDDLLFTLGGYYVVVVSFFEITFECNAVAFECSKCGYASECGKFISCFGCIPKIQWSMVTSFDDLTECLNKWGEYNNGKTDEH